MSATGFGDVSFRVETEVLRRQAQEVTRRLAAMEQRFREMDNVVRRSHSYWAGESAQIYRRLYEGQRDTADRILNRLRAYPGDLMQIAGNYDRNEDALTVAGAVLREGIIH